MTPTEREEAVARALHVHRTASNDLYGDWGEEVRTALGAAYVRRVRAEARAAIAALDIEKIEREAYERGCQDTWDTQEFASRKLDTMFGSVLQMQTTVSELVKQWKFLSERMGGVLGSLTEAETDDTN